jgi:alpha 1,3-glucosidase
MAGKIFDEGTATALNLLVSVVGDGAIRVKITENAERYAPNTLLLPEAHKPKPFRMVKAGEGVLPRELRGLPHSELIALTFDDSILAIHPATLTFELYCQGVLQASANSRSMMHFETSGGEKRRELSETKESEEDRHGGKEVVDYWEDGLAIYADGTKEERRLDQKADVTGTSSVEGDNFGGHKDSQPHGPKSVGIDFSFPFAQHVYGIPEHATTLSLPTTTKGSANVAPKYNEPFRLYNLDVFEYELDNSMALYGAIPLMFAHGLVENKGTTTAVFWFNPSETFIDISDETPNNHKSTHWISESGNIDFFFLPGPSVKEVYRQYASLTGTQQLPPMFSLGYHQCRWNYRDQKDVAQVEGMFEELDFPMDVLWLDIEHTNGKRYWTWDKGVFPDPIEMQKNVSAHGRKMVTIVDPHIKRDNNWGTHNEATSLGYYIKDKHGKDYDGWCWPGSSSYLDFTSEKVRLWWQQQFTLSKYIGSTMDLFTWNDMNEPSVFNGPEVSMPKDTKNLEGVEHREWHNLYGIYMQMATALGLQNRQTVPVPLRGEIESAPGATTDLVQAPSEELQRPFVLTRAFWAGSQRWGAMWTGDNTATWGHLKIAAPMLLSINLAGLSFAGADVGGFFKDPNAELFTRWYQAGSFTPFFRGHAHLDTKRREPWVFGDPYTGILRHAAMIRYSLLPYWYTTFHEAYITGNPVMRTMFSEFPDNAATFTVEDQWMVGSSLLVKPITDEGATSTKVLLPGTSNWFDFYSLKAEAPSDSSPKDVAAPLDTIPVFIRGGSIIPRKMRLRRSSKLMFHDPFTLVIAPDSATGEANGQLYMDDEATLAHETSSSFAVQEFTFSNNVLKSATAVGVPKRFPAENTVERIEIAGQTQAPKRVVLLEEGEAGVDLVHFYDAERRVVTIKKPDVKALGDWTITMEK